MVDRIKLDQDAKDRIRQAWPFRAMMAASKAAAGGDPMFLILQAALGYTPTRFPYYEVFAIVDEDGFIRTNIYRSDGRRDNAIRICSSADLRDNLNRLADAIKATDPERVHMFQKIAKWVRYDDREGQANVAHERLPGVAAAKRHDIN